MEYQITITKREPNENYKEEMKTWSSLTKNNFGRTYNEVAAEPERTNFIDVLICSLTEVQFKAIKAAVLKEFI